MRRLILNKIASDIGDIVCVGIHALDIGVLTASCTARSSTITIGYVGVGRPRDGRGWPPREIPSAGLNESGCVLPVPTILWSSPRPRARPLGVFRDAGAAKIPPQNRAYEVDSFMGSPLSAARMETKTLEPVDIPEVAIETLQAKYHRGAASERPGLRALEEDNLEAGRNLAE